MTAPPNQSLEVQRPDHGATTPSTGIGGGRVVVLTVVMVLASAWFWPRVARTSMIQYTLAACALGCGGAFLFLRRQPLALRIRLRRPHWVQILTQGSIYGYWAYYVPEVVDQLPLMGAQLVLGYALDGLVSWSRRGVWELGCGPVPIVGSINLFLWCRDEWWFLQAAMIIIAFFGREWIRWQRNGRSTHIFNPSGLALFIISAGVIVTDNTALTWGELIATSLNVPPHMFAVIFVAGLVVQVLFDTTLITTMAALTVWALVEVYAWTTGSFFFIDSHIPIAVFLGMNLLITDPATSPRSGAGRVVFGASYGLMVLPLWTGLQWMGQPAFFDKLLQVPLLNVCVPLFERLGQALAPKVDTRRWAKANLTHVGVWCGCFAFLYPGLVDHPGRDSGYWRADCERGQSKACNNLRHVLAGNCGRGEGSACGELAHRLEDVRSLYFAPDEAETLRKRGCALGHAPSCVVEKKGRVGTLYISRGELLEYREACTMNPRACTQLGHVLLKSRNGPNWGVEAYDAYEQACGAKDWDACANMALMKLKGDGVAKDAKAAISINEAACGGGLAVACARAATLLMTRAESHGAASTETARRLMRKACDLGDFGACVTADSWQTQRR